jgi:hypothetical protein
MAKAGSEYEELVALVAKAIHRDAEIATGKWVEGPDGKREVDVEVRGTIDGRPHFVHIECKDWKQPVDIKEIDNLDSKRKDLSADAAILFSNSGFTKKALRKAERVGIDAVSAIAEGNNLIRPVIERVMTAKQLSVDSVRMTLYPNEQSNEDIPDGWDFRRLEYNRLPVINWLQNLSLDLIRKHEDESRIIETVAFKKETVFELEGTPVVLRGFRIDMSCSKKWVSQTIREDVSLGFYNHVTRRLTIPDKQYMTMGTIDNEGWDLIENEDGRDYFETSLEPGTFRLDLTLLNPIRAIEGKNTPSIDELINERKTEFE